MIDLEKEGVFDFPCGHLYWGKTTKEQNDKIVELSLSARNVAKNAKHKLVGNITRSVDAPKEIDDILLPHIFDVCEKLNGNPGDREWKKVDTWINFQRKYEFNPVHGHSGHFSYVYWAKIPYNIEEERNLSFVTNAATQAAGCFAFVWSNIFGRMSSHEIPISKEDEGRFIVFPSILLHTVYPFYTSDEERISLSGNITYKYLKSDNAPQEISSYECNGKLV